MVIIPESAVVNHKVYLSLELLKSQVSHHLLIKREIIQLYQMNKMAKKKYHWHQFHNIC